MKRCTAIIVLLILLLCSLPACQREQEMERPVNFYYRTAELHYQTDSTVIDAEQRECIRFENTRQILEHYLQGPQSAALRSPFPAGLRLISMENDPKLFIIYLSQEFASLTDLDLMIACGCIAHTCMDLTGAECVSIRVDGALLNGQTEIRIDRDTLMLLDNCTPKEE